MRHDMRAGFTLIELIIVIVIIGILASIAAPMMQGMKQKAIISEAVVALGTLRTALRAYNTANTTTWPPAGGCYWLTVTGFDWGEIGINPDDFAGSYFSKDCYLVENVGGDISYWCYAENTTAALADITKTIIGKAAMSGIIKMTKDGKLYQRNIIGSGYPPF